MRGRWRSPGRGESDIFGVDPADLVVLRPDVVEATVGARVHQSHPGSIGQVLEDRAGTGRIATKIGAAVGGGLLGPK